MKHPGPPLPLSGAAAPPLQIGRAEINYAQVQAILTRATGFLDAYDFTLNPYSGCSFACSYCYAAFFVRDPSKVDSWGRWVTVKENAVERLERRRHSLDGKRIYMSSVTDPYQPIERKLGLTRRLLEVLARRHRPKLVVQTRSPDVVRDHDLLRAITARGGRVQVNMTVTTDDEEIRRTFEPSCPDNRKRLEAAAWLQAAGIETCITMTPLLLIRDVHAFAEDLLATGIRKFILQPFQFQGGRFVAGTREPARQLMAEKLDSTPETFHTAYLEHCRQAQAVLAERLPCLGEGKDGFRPPF